MIVAIAAAWFAGAFAADREFGRNLLETQTWGRFTQIEQHKKPFHYYLGSLATLLPVALFAAGEGWLQTFKRARSRASIFALGWFVLVVLFLSISKTKRSYYVMPAYPAVAVLAAAILDRRDIEVTTIRDIVLRALAPLLGIAGLVAACLGIYDRELVGVGLSLALGAFLGAGALVLLREKKPALALGAAVAFTVAGIANAGVPVVEAKHGYREFAKTLLDEGVPREAIAVSPGGVHREMLCWELAPSPLVGMTNIETKTDKADIESVRAWLEKFPPRKAAVIIRVKDAVGPLDPQKEPSLVVLAQSGENDLVAIGRR